MASEERGQEPEQECLYKTKVVQFLGRTTPIILQNDNGPCPLLAICNVLLLKNNLNLSVDTSEVSLQKLLSLVAERLIDSNSNVENKDAGYVENQQQNIADAIDLLPRLATGIDVNIQFRRVGDFEFTRECAIFDLLDIPLYHGWIVDPQDCDTANAIGSKSYNTLVGELVSLEARNTEEEHKSSPEEDCIDFSAATTATLGVPSPCLSRVRSFDDSPSYLSGNQKIRKGDMEEEAELLRALKLSEAELATSMGESLLADASGSNMPLNNKEPGGHFASSEIVGNVTDEASVQNHSKPIRLLDSNSSSACNDHVPIDREKQQIQQTGAQDTSTSEVCCEPADQSGCKTTLFSSPFATNLVSDVSIGGIKHMDEPKGATSSLDGSEPIYEGEECILDSGLKLYQNREPMYEGEMVLAEQADKAGGVEQCPENEITEQKGELIRNFLRNNASQLTIYGLFCLQEGLKERELCVFFRNNHFSTMFKFNGELYLLATDQGFINQPDLVWEKLNEVNGDTVFITGNFKEFKIEDHINDQWDEQNAMASTADFIASIDNSTGAGSTLNSDLQLAIALQQQEFENQPQRQNLQQLSVGNSRLVIGPQAPRTSGNPSSKQDAKSKEKCTVM
ncbi:PREDICTED: ubiquitin carboxyl-terminal hydrolase MINDY-1 isoform X2 [Nelumbo nucifera]|uniref:Ubiquitin carboxyl-terminal hydrolase MINDY-1 isoform X2 n=1 Tax=Nelumbo nucifera TaxID=4432 RepID=A0A1U8B0L0_NELNU|nr:PREDICTED: ubiquitin carboxyl-terminal hydrolase MINDY-1 isoform X2 [Nelumbo nucifera]